MISLRQYFMAALKRYKPTKKTRRRGSIDPIRHPVVGVGREIKWRDNVFSLAPVKNTGDFFHFSDMPQGPGFDRRVGRTVVITSVAVRYVLENTPKDNISFGQAEDIIRIIIYVDHQTNGAAPLATDILQSTTVNSFRNLHNVARFSILADRQHVVVHGSASGDGTNNDFGSTFRPYTFYTKCNIPIIYTGTSGDIAGNNSNSVGAFVLSFSPQEDAHLHGIARVRYSDS